MRASFAKVNQSNQPFVLQLACVGTWLSGAADCLLLYIFQPVAGVGSGHALIGPGTLADRFRTHPERPARASCSPEASRRQRGPAGSQRRPSSSSQEGGVAAGGRGRARREQAGAWSARGGGQGRPATGRREAENEMVVLVMIRRHRRKGSGQQPSTEVDPGEGLITDERPGSGRSW